MVRGVVTLRYKLPAVVGGGVVSSVVTLRCRLPVVVVGVWLGWKVGVFSYK